MKTTQRPHVDKRWNLAAAHPDAADLAARLKVSPLVAQMLLNRGMSEPDVCTRFLRPTLKDLHDPSLLAGLAKAAARVAKAIGDKEKIVIYGDYDVDGITAVSILWHAIKLLGGDVHYYIPHRIDEGYGLNSDAVAEICQQGAKLIITVDCGVTAIEPAAVAKDRGVDLIITDHHEILAASSDADGKSAHHLPTAYAIVHPRLAGDDGQVYPNPDLCGAGVAFKLAWGIGQAVNGATKVSEAFRAFLVEATALAALGTIADVVPLIGENRALAHFGLGGLKASHLTGIQALIEVAGLSGQKLESFDVGFKLGPRLNACGRMGHASMAVEMLTIADHARAVEIATYLDQQNRERQATQRQILASAIEQVESNGYAGDDCYGIVVADGSWHAGVIGVVASRLVELFNRPAVMIALDEQGIGHGSARSIDGFHLADALTHCTDHLLSHGGHAMAAGLRIAGDRVASFREAFCAYAASQLSADDLMPQLDLDVVAELGAINEALVGDLKRLGPFGQGNRRPLLCCRNLTLALPPRRVGKTGEHLQLFLKQGSTNIKAIAFGANWAFDDLTPGVTLDLAAEASINEYNGRRSVELDVKDLHIH